MLNDTGIGKELNTPLTTVVLPAPEGPDITTSFPGA
jgi:hypothetical protein